MRDEKVVLFSLIIPTIHRRGELACLLTTIEAQSFRDFEVIIVDQNSDGLIDDICNKFKRRMLLSQRKITTRGAAHARNHGLQFSKGALINFPDDDCEYSPELLSSIARRFEELPSLDGLFGRAVDPDSGESSVTRFQMQPDVVTQANLYSTTVEFTMFIRRRLFVDLGAFDENLGVGTFFGAEEGADFVLRALYKKKLFYYDPSLLLLHAQKTGQFDEREQTRAYNYGKGFGRLSVKHVFLYGNSYAAFRFIIFQLRAAIAMLLFALLLKPRRSAYYLRLVHGRMVGLIKSWPEFTKQRANNHKLTD